MADQTDDLIAAVKLYNFLPESQLNYTNSDILFIGDYEVLNTLAPILVSLDSGFYLTHEDVPFVAGQSDYEAPEYAMWNKYRRIDRVNDDQLVPLLRLEVDNLPYYNTNQDGTPYYFFFKHDTISFFPTPQAGITDSYRIYYYRKPGLMVEISAAAQVLSVNTVNGEVTYTAAPPATFTNISFHDFYNGKSPFNLRENNVQATAILGAVQTFPVADVQTLQPGDWVNIVNETVFPPIPRELQPTLQELIIKVLTRSTLDPEAYALQRQEIAERAESIMKSAPGVRDVGQPKKMSFFGNSRIIGNFGRRWWP